MGEVFRELAEAGSDRVLVDVVAVLFVIVSVADAVVGEASLPDGEGGVEAVGEAPFDEHHGSFEGDVLWGKEEMDVVGHDDEGVETVVAFVAVMLEGFEEELGCAVDLKEAASVVSDACDEVGSRQVLAFGDRHGWA